MFKKLLFTLLVIALFTGTAFAQAASGSQTMDLKSGFNFVSFSVKPSMQAADFKNQNPAIQEIYSYSAASGAFLSVSEGTLATLAAGKGYIVKAAVPTVLNITGELIQTVGTINLKAGFNLIGISKAVTAMKFSDLIKAGSAIRGLYKFSAASGAFIQVLKNASGLIELPDMIDPTFTIGQSYFIYAASDTTMSYDNGNITIAGASAEPALTGITAINGSVNAIFSAQLTTAPVIGNFILKINGINTNMYSVMPYGQTTYQLTFPLVAQTDADQTISVELAYNGAIKAASYIVPGTGVNAIVIPAVTGVTYDPAANKIKWLPVTSASLPAGALVQYNLKFDNGGLMSAGYALEFTVPAVIFYGNHTVQVQAAIPASGATAAKAGPWSPSPAHNFTIGIPAVTGIIYDATAHKIKWQPVTSANIPSGTMVQYNLRFDNGGLMSAGSALEFPVSSLIFSGTHTVQVQAAVPASGATTEVLTGPWSPNPAMNFMPNVVWLLNAAAVNGTITATLSATPSTLPTTADFVVNQYINGATTSVAISSAASTSSVVILTVPMIAQTNAVQNIAFVVTYKGGAPKNAQFSIPAHPAVDPVQNFSFLNQSNGSMTLAFTPALTVSPTAANFTIGQSLNNGAFSPITPVSVNGGMGTTSVTITVPMANADITETNLRYRVSYQNGAPVICTPISIPASAGTSSVTIASATNGMIYTSITPAPLSAPVKENFQVKIVLDGFETNAVILSVSGMSAVPISVQPVPAASSEVRFTYKVSYLNGSWISSPEIVVQAVAGGAVANPLLSVSPGNYNSTQSVSLTCQTYASIIKYTVSTVSGSNEIILDPKTNGAYFLPNNPIQVPPNSYVKIRYYAYALGMQDSQVLEAVYNHPAPTGFVYDAAAKKLKWDPIVPPAGGHVIYRISLTGPEGQFTTVMTSEIAIQAGTPAGTADLYAIINNGTANQDSLHTATSYTAAAPPLMGER